MDAINLMGGVLDWSALPTVSGWLGVADLELFARRITALLNNRG